MNERHIFCIPREIDLYFHFSFPGMFTYIGKLGEKTYCRLSPVAAKSVSSDFRYRCCCDGIDYENKIVACLICIIFKKEIRMILYMRTVCLA